MPVPGETGKVRIVKEPTPMVDYNPWAELWTNLSKMFQEAVTVEPPVTYEKALKAQGQYLGMASAMQLSAMVLATLTELPGLGMLRTPSKIVDSLYWLFGLGFLGWQVMAPPMRYSILDPLDEYYRRLYRPNDLKESEAQEAFELGLITEEKYIDVLQKNGYNDEAIKVKVQLRRIKILERQGIKVTRELPLPRSEAEEAYLNGFIDEEGLAKAYADLGYTNDAITVMLANIMKKKARAK
ncbi:hypothetical protein [Huginn virus]|nr:hypothetical protein [Huginn virus]